MKKEKATPKIKTQCHTCHGFVAHKLYGHPNPTIYIESSFYVVLQYCTLLPVQFYSLLEYAYKCNPYPGDMFLPLAIEVAIEVFGCLHYQVDNFLDQCAIMAWSTKGIVGSPSMMLHSFYKQKVLIALQRA